MSKAKGQNKHSVIKGEQVEFRSLYVPIALSESIKKLAKEQGRSINSQIVMMLKRASETAKE